MQLSLPRIWCISVNASQDEFRNIFDDINDSDFRCPFRSDVIEVVMKRMDSKIDHILAQKVEFRRLGRVTVFQDNLKFQFLHER